MPRPRKFVESDVVSSAGEVFAEHGLAAATLDDLVRATGLGKQSLYNAFGGKRDLFFRALSEDREEAARAVSEALSHGDAAPLERVRGQMLRLAIEFSRSDVRVSLTTRALVESTGEQDQLSTATKAGIEELAGIYAHCLEVARAAGDLPADANVSSLAMYFVAVTRGMELLGRAGVGRAVLTAVALDSLRVLGTPGIISDEDSPGIISDEDALGIVSDEDSPGVTPDENAPGSRVAGNASE
jgi:TetR/AcrR family transcriptional regulator, transcriptional repressor for nem operon